MLNKFRGIGRFLIFVIVLGWYVLCLLIEGLFKGLTLDLGLDYRRRFCRAAMKILHIKVTTQGMIRTGNFLFISNHRSYVDPMAQLKDIVALPVAKAEVQKLPILGYGAKITGVHFVDRKSRQSRKETRSGIAQTIEAGNAILIYPEGTTFKTPQSGDFKSGTFDMAAKNKIRIIPVAIEYRHPKDPWVGPEGMFAHFFTAFGRKQMEIEIHYGEPIWTKDSKALQKAVKDWIDGELLAIRKKWGLKI